MSSKSASMSPNRTQPFYKRILSNPRIVIYTLAVLIVAILMRMDERRKNPPPAKTPATSPSVVTETTPLPYKESEMRAASSLPKLYALIEEGEEPAWVQELRKDAQGKYTLLVIKGNEEMKQFFNVESLPMIILMDADGHEISRKIPR